MGDFYDKSIAVSTLQMYPLFVFCPELTSGSQVLAVSGVTADLSCDAGFPPVLIGHLVTDGPLHLCRKGRPMRDRLVGRVSDSPILTGG